MEKKNQRKSASSRHADRVIQERTLWFMLLLGVAVFIALFVKLYSLQILQHDDLEGRAVRQQTRSTSVTASRGTIYDRNGNILAISATAETIFASPLEFLNSYKKAYGDADYQSYYDQGKQEMAEGLAPILGIDAESILTKLEKTSSQYEILKRQADEETCTAVRAFLNEHQMKGVYLVTDAKRYYPYGDLASHVIGFVGTDGYGLYGLEATKNETLEGENGLVVTAKSNDGTDLLYQYEQYYDAKNGDSLVTTIDTTVQYYLEQGLKTLEAKYGTGKGAAGVVMDPRSGAILGMASLPNYDLNDPRSIHDEHLQAELQATLDDILENRGEDTSEEETPGEEPSDEEAPDEEGGEAEALAAAITEKDAKSSDAYIEKLSELQLKQWRNRCVNDTYEPGSTFKIITLSTALEEGTVNLNSHFVCGGKVRVPGFTEIINCSAKRGHGTQTLTQATGNSCNPAYVAIGLSIGTDLYYKYLKDFGLLSPTGIELNGETGGIAASPSAFNNLDLACYAFGQNVNVTPLGLITAQCAAINGGYLHKPYVVSQVLDSAGNVKMQQDTTVVRQVISESTSETVRGILEYVVASGTGKNGQVADYRIGGKTGTADKGQTGDVVVSFFCFAPADDPQVAMLMTLDTPSRTTGTYVSGGQMVAPVASSVMAELLPYLGIRSELSDSADTTVPNVVGSTLADAKAKLAAKELNFRLVGSGNTVTDQTPVGGAIIPANSTVVLYCGQNKSDEKVTVPNVLGLTASQANQRLTNAGLIIKVTGANSGNSVYAISQSLAADTEVPAGSVVTVQFGDTSLLD